MIIETINLIHLAEPHYILEYVITTRMIRTGTLWCRKTDPQLISKLGDSMNKAKATRR